ncbi:MAG: hypothetical protein NTX91_02055 [candidate division SR1 bacterium]|nr:hypothetical protein [candidate division SR1 bacterium]
MAKKRMTTVICGKFTAALNNRRFYKLVELIYVKDVLVERRPTGKTFRGSNFPEHKAKVDHYYEIHRVPHTPGKHKELTHKSVKQPINKPVEQP